jgi:bifunctional UDP-N-acetylglucosamine pyrophosphorylase/glucosamine-1-phosphate N-acetyltransferase
LKAVILAAGKGERLEPITHTRPKSFVPILGKPLIRIILEEIKNFVDNIIIVISKDNEIYFKNLENIKLVYQPDDLRGTAAALKAVSNYIKDEFLVIYGDIFTNYSKIISNIIKYKNNVILGVKVKEIKDYGLLMYKNGELIDIIEKPTDLKISSSEEFLVNGGIYKFDEEIFHYIDKIKMSSRGELELTDAISIMAKQSKISILKYDDYWIDIGKPWNLMDANKLALEIYPHSLIRGDVEEFVKIKGKVIIEEGARIKSGTYIEGPCYIAENTEVGPNAYIRPFSIIGKNSRIGASVEVKESIIMENVRISHLSYVGDSIIGEGTNFGAGTITANLRFDKAEVKVNIKGEKVSSGRSKLGAIVGGYVQTGIHVSIMPGIKIGAYAIIYPGVVVKRDVKYGEIVKV